MGNVREDSLVAQVGVVNVSVREGSLVGQAGVGKA